jgi:hypothetical protein
MIGSLTILTVAVLAAATQTDTTVAVKPGTRLELSNFGGTIAVTTWARNSVRVRAEHSSRVEIELQASGPTLGIEAVHWRGVPTTVDYELTVPKWMALELSGVSTDVSVENAEGEVKIESVQGEVSVKGGTGLVTASPIEGAVRVVGARGRIEGSSVNGSVHVERSSGPVSASSVNGEIHLTTIDSEDVEASTINGGVSYDGALKDGGSYRFSTHGGDLVVTVPERANAAVTVSTFSGEFTSEFPIQLQETRKGGRFGFTLGNGDARLELESFQGTIRLRRPGSPEAKAGDGYRREQKQTRKTVKTERKNSADEENEP